MTNKILIILFPGFGTSKKMWYSEIIKNKIIKHDFIKQLKNIGELYFYEPKYYNLFYYTKNKIDKLLYHKNINYNNDDLCIDKICDTIFNNIKEYIDKNYKLILLGHSIGSHLVYYFSNKYYKYCLFNVIIDGACLMKSNDYIYKYDKDKKLIDKHSNYSDEYIEKLKKDIDNEKSLNKLMCNSLYKLLSFYNKSTIEPFKIPTIAFYNFELIKKYDDLRLNEINYLVKNNKDFKYITFIKKTHFPHHKEDSRNIIIDNIKIMLNNIFN